MILGNVVYLGGTMTGPVARFNVVCYTGLVHIPVMGCQFILSVNG